MGRKTRFSQACLLYASKAQEFLGESEKKTKTSLFSCARYEPIWWIYRAGWQLCKKLDSLTLDKSFEPSLIFAFD